MSYFIAIKLLFLRSITGGVAQLSVARSVYRGGFIEKFINGSINGCEAKQRSTKKEYGIQNRITALTHT